ncbi:hypothetical protein SO802_015289 [Lithocarpus litseifolius]|uniref:Uncharacterized protein n=1 Tax=Lithocarpus litseifolius TaxID=425828 RepID=A0AAW2CVN7_9ROSI
MTSSAEKRNKGKAPIQDYPQDRRLPAGQSFVNHEGASPKGNQRGSTSLQESIPVDVTYSSGDMAVILQEVLSKKLQFNDGAYIDLPYSIKTILDNLHLAYTIKHHGLFQRTLKALEIHLVNLEARNEAITSLLSGKDEIRSKDKTVKMGTDYARLSLKASLRSAVANLPTEIQILVTTPYPDLDNSDDMRDIFAQATWEEYFGCSLKVYEKEHPFPSLLINYEDGPDEEDEMGPYWLSRMFEYGFIKEIKLTIHNQILEHTPTMGKRQLDDCATLKALSTHQWVLPPWPLRTIALVTRSQTSLDPVQIAGKSSKEIKDLAQQLLLQLEELGSQEKGSPTSLEASANFDPNDPLFPNSQDMNDAYRLDSE